MKELHDYVKNIKSKIEPSTEYTLRTDFEILLNAQKPRTSIEIEATKKILMSYVWDGFNSQNSTHFFYYLCGTMYIIPNFYIYLLYGIKK